MFVINAKIRQEQGKSASRRLRHAGKFPAIVYGGQETALAIELDHDQLNNMQEKTGFYSDVLTLKIDNNTEVKVKVQAVQRHPFKPKITHLDLLRV